MIDLHTFAETVTYLEGNPGAPVYRYGRFYPKFINVGASYITKYWSAAEPDLYLRVTNCSSDVDGWSYSAYNPPSIFSAEDTRAADWIFETKEDWEKAKQTFQEQLEANRKALRLEEEKVKARWLSQANNIINTSNTVVMSDYPLPKSNYSIFKDVLDRVYNWFFYK